MANSSATRPSSVPTASGKRVGEPLIAGVDEAGRGPLAGPVVAAAVAFAPGTMPEGLADSKKLSAARREALYEQILASALCYGIAHVGVTEIDRLNILQASLLAMHRAVAQLSPSPTFVQVDGNRCPQWQWDSEAIVGGDDSVPLISAASILAKQSRDREMCALDGVYPGYGFAEHKGYATAAHLARLRELGPCDAHRRSFAPVRAALGEGQLDLLGTVGGAHAD